MAAIDTKLFFNLSTQQFVASAEDGADAGIPSWYYLDVRNLLVTFVKTNDSGGGISVVTDAISVQCGIGTPTGSAGTVASSATAGPPVSNVFPILLPLNLAAVLALFTSNAPINTTIEFLITTATTATRYEAQIALQKPLLVGATADPPPGDRALGAAEAVNLYVPKQGVVNMNEIKVSPSGFQFLVSVSDDGILTATRIP